MEQKPSLQKYHSIHAPKLPDLTALTSAKKWDAGRRRVVDGPAGGGGGKVEEYDTRLKL